MRIVRFQPSEGPPRFGVLDDGVVRAAEGSFDEGFAPDGPPIDLQQVRLLAPTEPRTVMCVGRNYADHATELGNEVPAEPLLFLKPPASVIAPGDPIVHPSLSSRVEHEAELVVVIGRPAHRIRAEDAAAHIFGWTLANDVTARDLQRSDPQWTRGKGFDTFCPLGPWIDTDIDLADAGSLDIGCEVNGVSRQHDRAANMLFAVPELLAYVTRFTRLGPGDVLLTGTPAGVGPLVPGDVVAVRSERLGELVNPVVAEDATPAGPDADDT